MPNVSLALVDDQRLFSETLKLLLQTLPEFEVLFASDNAAGFLQQLEAATIKPQIALLDIDMPGMNGIELNRLLQKQYPELKVIMLSVHLEQELIARVIDDGAAAYLTKNCNKEELVSTILAVKKDGFYINQLTLQALTRAAKSKGKSKPVKSSDALPSGLTRREKEVLLLTCQELTTAEIADRLFLSARTVEGHRMNLLSKTGCKNNAGLVIFAIRHRLFEVT
jgi:DNA-binding NarL/FixJ family response regulator